MGARTTLRTGLHPGLFAVALAAAISAGGLAIAQVWTGSSSTDDLQYRLSIIDAELADIRARLGVAPGQKPGQKPAGGTGGVAGDAMVRIDRLEAELQRLTGLMEQIQFEQRRIAEDAAQRFGDIEFRLTELEGGDTSAIPAVTPLGGIQQGGAPQVAVSPEVSVSERGDLDRAIDDVKKGRFDQGEDRLRQFLNAYPGSPLEGEAFYWLGESQFIRGAFQNAARSFLDGYNRNRTGPNAPNSLYKLGVSLGRLGQVSEACLTLREVRKQFPTGPAELLDAADAESRSLNCG